SPDRSHLRINPRYLYAHHRRGERHYALRNSLLYCSPFAKGRMALMHGGESWRRSMLRLCPRRIKIIRSSSTASSETHTTSPRFRRPVFAGSLPAVGRVAAARILVNPATRRQGGENQNPT